ncbi:MAG TPA: SCO family protein [Trebonia sp.]|nr:SCO family protein [Trebonia sp.]
MLRGINRTRRATWLAGLAVSAALAVAGCSSASSQPASSSPAGPANPASAAAMENPNLDLGTSLDNKPAPAIKLVNQFGQSMSLSQFRGRVVVLSFEDSECTTVCPLTTQAMVLAKELLGKAGDSVQLLGVDANPDAIKVSDVMAYSRVHGMVNQWDFLTGSLAQLKSVWKSYDIAVQIEQGQIDHTPALYVVDQQGRLQKVYLTQMAYSSVTQSAQVLASEVAGLLPSHPKLSSVESLAAIPGQSPADSVSLPAAAPAAGGTGASTVPLGPGKPRLVVFFATWLTETSDLNAELTGLNAYVKAAAGKHLPALTAVDETVTEPSKAAVTSYLQKLGPLSYPVALDETGRVADGYGVQDQPWLELVNAAGKVTWQHDGWVPLGTLEQAATAHP